uniref:Acyl-CoA desaturase-like n=1 Tax=Dermatophagoides pteronyssinus TaxID=6956 RepID=A0A6P6Y4R7_DERPT|nr:acyl-CoA desaturase-like [Dermatophagoides pteronyssinus]
MNNKKIKTFSNDSVQPYDWKWNWSFIIPLTIGHIGALFGIYLAILYASIKTLVFYFILIQFGATGIICGAHRLWTHRAYRAHYILRIFLMLCQTLALQLSILQWCQFHRVHHKFSDTDADPHNAKRGFFFSHMGWVLVDHHPEYNEKSQKIDMSDLKNDPIVWFQHRFYVPLVLLITFMIPTLIPCLLWNESLMNATFVNLFRIALSLHQTALVNSAAHIWGLKPYDERIKPTENKFTTYVTMGEAYHNYHHAFPWDYSASEFRWDVNYNPMTAFIDICALLNLAWDRKKVDRKMIEERLNKHGNQQLINIIDRKPKSLLFDTLFGVLTLFWALWMLLALRMVCVHYHFIIIIVV